MIPFGTQTITLLHNYSGVYAKTIISGCSWQSTDVRTLDGVNVVVSVETVCRIPVGEPKPAPGDLLILGEHNAFAKNEIELVRLMQRLRADGTPAFRAQRVKDNTTGVPLPHYAVSGG